MKRFQVGPPIESWQLASANTGRENGQTWTTLLRETASTCFFNPTPADVSGSARDDVVGIGSHVCVSVF